MFQYGFDENHSQKFITALAERLNVGAENAIAAYEDAWYYLWKERRLPVNVDPFDSKLEHAEDRERLAKVFEQGLQKVVGYVLPLRVRYGSIERNALGKRPVVCARGADVFDSGRFAGGLSLAAGFAAVVGAGETSIVFMSTIRLAERGPLPRFSHERRFGGMPHSPPHWRGRAAIRATAIYSSIRGR